MYYSPSIPIGNIKSIQQTGHISVGEKELFVKSVHMEKMNMPHSMNFKSFLQEYYYGLYFFPIGQSTISLR